MADSKISDLPSGGAVQATDEFAVARSGTSVKIAASAISGSVSPPVEFVGTDPAEAVLTLRADDAQDEHIFRVYDLDGNLSVDIDSVGRLDTKRVVCQDPPDTGGGTGTSSATIAPDQITVFSGSDTVQHPLLVRRWNAGTSTVDTVATVGRTGAILRLQTMTSGNEVGIELAASQDGTGNAIELWDWPFDNLLFALGYDGTITVTPPAGATYSASNVTTDRTYDADATTINELADVLGTLIADLRAQGIVA